MNRGIIFKKYRVVSENFAPPSLSPWNAELIKQENHFGSEGNKEYSYHCQKFTVSYYHAL